MIDRFYTTLFAALQVVLLDLGAGARPPLLGAIAVVLLGRLAWFLLGELFFS